MDLFIRAERVGREAALAPEVREREVLVTIANIARHGHFARPDLDLVLAADLRLGGIENAVAAGDLKADETSGGQGLLGADTVAHFEPCPHIVEADNHLIEARERLFVGWADGVDVFTVGDFLG